MAASDIRVSDEERDSALSALGEHLSTGRLDLAEFEERSRRASTARVRGDIEPLFTDLPAPHPDLESASPPGELIRQAGQRLSPSLPGKKTELVETPASKAMDTLAGTALVFGIPAAILLTIFLGQWWVFIPVSLVFFVSAAVSDTIKRNPPKP